MNTRSMIAELHVEEHALKTRLREVQVAIDALARIAGSNGKKPRASIVRPDDARQMILTELGREHPGWLTVKEIAERAQPGGDPSWVYREIKNLRADGLIEPHDAKQKRYLKWRIARESEAKIHITTR